MKSAAADTEDYEDIALDESRLEEALALSSEAGWNQEPDDWRLLFRQASVFGRVRRRDGAVIGSAAVLPLGQGLSWIGMVLVTGTERRRGHARYLMRLAIDQIRSGTVAGLDATPAGLALYRSLGFSEAGTLMRMRCDALPRGGGGADTRENVRRAAAGDLARICNYDTQAFGADRTAILHNLHSRCPRTAFFAEVDGRLTGFILARPGRLATQIGPLVADDHSTAEHLLRAALASVSAPVIVDAFTSHTTMCRLLDDLGFTEQRPFTRMFTNSAHLPTEGTILSAGPELG